MIEKLNKWSYSEINEAVSSATCSSEAAAMSLSCKHALYWRTWPMERYVFYLQKTLRSSVELGLAHCNTWTCTS